MAECQTTKEAVNIDKSLWDKPETLKFFIDNSADVIWQMDLDMRFSFISNSCENMSLGFKREEFIGKSLLDYLTSEGIECVKQGYDRRMQAESQGIKTEVARYELQLKLKNDEFFWAEVNACPYRDHTGKLVGYHGIMRDISKRKHDEEERKRLEESLKRAEKMEALGLLAGGVAHDLNNVLGVVVGYSELLLMELGKESPLQKNVTNIINSGERAAAIVQDLLTLARRGMSSRKAVNINDIISSYLKGPEYKKLSGINDQFDLTVNLAPNLLNIKGSALHLEKTITNLISNAAESLSDRRSIHIETRNCYLDLPIRGYDHVQQGEYVVVSVKDSGGGISNVDMAHVFEPFYTKKMMGRGGTGLGLAVVWGTVKDHEGYVDIHSERGKGTTFTLYFPVSREDVRDDRSLPSNSDHRGNAESILVVDDVEEQRDLAVNLLSRLNYQVTAVASGEEAVEYLKEKEVNLIILDMIMDPGLDGLETYKRILAVNPRQKAIIVSGFAETDRVAQAHILGAGAYVKKPYMLDDLAAAVRSELDNKIKMIMMSGIIHEEYLSKMSAESIQPCSR